MVPRLTLIVVSTQKSTRSLDPSFPKVNKILDWLNTLNKVISYLGSHVECEGL